MTNIWGAKYSVDCLMEGLSVILTVTVVERLLEAEIATPSPRTARVKIEIRLSATLSCPLTLILGDGTVCLDAAAEPARVEV